MSKKAITIFGGTGDLSYRKLMPALYILYSRNLLGDDFDICAIGRRNYSKAEYLEIIKSWIKTYSRMKYDEEILHNFFQHINYLKMDFSKDSEYFKLEDYYSNKNIDNHIVYLAVAPNFFDTISDGINGVQSIINPKIILEKPFGESLEKAKYLNSKVVEYFKSENVYRIDHYLGKEMIRNILSLRMTNPMFASIWGNKDIDSVYISALETLGVETRGAYYDDAGALMDMIQNHLFQILSVVALDNPEAEIHREQYNVLKKLRPVSELNIEDSMLLAQYEGYKTEENVNPNSTTETYAALKVYVDNIRWYGVPFFIRTGKKCDNREVEVIIKFKKMAPNIEPNILAIKIQPIEGIYLEFNIKTPGEESGLTKAKMEFCQSCEDIFRQNTPEAYERMLDACFRGDKSWFSTWEQIELSWDYINKLKEEYSKNQLPIYTYEQGSRGPKELTWDI